MAAFEVAVAAMHHLRLTMDRTCALTLVASSDKSPSAAASAAASAGGGLGSIGSSSVSNANAPVGLRGADHAAAIFQALQNQLPGAFTDPRIRYYMVPCETSELTTKDSMNLC